MGKSDPYVFKSYINFYNEVFNHDNIFKSACFLGQTGDNHFSKNIKSEIRDFYDISLKNWNINDFPYDLKRKYDIIVCTRCPYFSNNPKKFIEALSNSLNKGGRIFLDWGLGDHLRYEKFRVGFQDNNEKEQCYFEGNYMSSCLWEDEFAQNKNVKVFSERIKKYGYEDLCKAVKNEVPEIISLKDVEVFFDNIQMLFLPLWEDSPQLYIILQGIKK